MSDLLTILNETNDEVDKAPDIPKVPEGAKVNGLINDLGNQQVIDIINNELSGEEKNKLNEATEKLKEIKEETKQLNDKKQEEEVEEKSPDQNIVIDIKDDEKDKNEEDVLSQGVIEEPNSEDFILPYMEVPDDLKVNLDKNTDQLQAISEANSRALNFRPKKIKRRTKVGFFGRISQAIGYTLSATLGWIFSAVGGILGRAVGKIKRSSHRKSLTAEQREKIQQRLSYNVIPGRGGETFADLEITDDENQEIFDDLRRIPIVWEKPTAENPNADPIFQMNANVTSLDASSERDSAHSFVTLYYTRKSRTSDKDIRYKVSFGFFPKGGTGADNGVMGLTGAYLPGQIKDETTNVYKMAKRFSVKNRQINMILKAVEGYPAGGYDIFQRNCTTFVADMGKTAGIDISNDMKRENMALGVLYMGHFITNAYTRYKRNMASVEMEKRLLKKDTSYQMFGQNMFSEDDVNRVLDTGNYGFLNPNGYTPAKTYDVLKSNAEEQFKEKGPDSIEYMRFSKSEKVSDKDGPYGEQVADKITAIATKLKDILKDENDLASQKLLLGKYIVRSYDLMLQKPSKIEDIVKRMEDVNVFQKDIQKWYYGVMGGDSRIWEPVYWINSIIEAYKDDLNWLFEIKENGETSREFRSMSTYEVLVLSDDGTGQNSEDDVFTDMKISQIPALIKIYGSLTVAAKKTEEYNALKNKNKEKLTPKELSALNAYKRNLESVNDFTSSYKRYAVSNDLDDFDLRYAFKENIEKEKSDRQKGNLVIKNTSSEIGTGFLQGVFYSRYYAGILSAMENSIELKSSDNDKFISAISKFLKEKTTGIVSEKGQDFNQFERAMAILLEDIMSDGKLSLDDKKSQMTERLTKSVFYSYVAVMYFDNAFTTRYNLYSNTTEAPIDAMYKDLNLKVIAENVFEPIINRLLENVLVSKESA